MCVCVYSIYSRGAPSLSITRIVNQHVVDARVYYNVIIIIIIVIIAGRPRVDRRQAGRRRGNLRRTELIVR